MKDFVKYFLNIQLEWIVDLFESCDMPFDISMFCLCKWHCNEIIKNKLLSWFLNQVKLQKSQLVADYLHLVKLDFQEIQMWLPEGF